MAIELYDSAKKIEKDGNVYYMLMQGSKNCFMYGGQNYIDKDLRTQWSTNEMRERDWNIRFKSKGNRLLADTYLNCPKFSMYGNILFGNGYNIALYLDNKAPTKYEELDTDQQDNFDRELNIAETRLAQEIKEYGAPKYSDTMRDLDQELPEERQFKEKHEYCGTEYHINDYKTEKDGRIYWKCDVL